MSIEEDKKKFEALEAKKEAFEADPNRFIDMEDLIVGIMDSENGIKFFVNGGKKRSVLLYAKGEVSYQVDSMLKLRDYHTMKEKQAKDQSPIVTADGGIITPEVIK